MKRSIHFNESSKCPVISIQTCYNFTQIWIHIYRNFDRLRERVARNSVFRYHIPFALPHTTTSHTHSKTHTHNYIPTLKDLHTLYLSLFHTQFHPTRTHDTLTHPTHTLSHAHNYIPQALRDTLSLSLSLLLSFSFSLLIMLLGCSYV